MATYVSLKKVRRWPNVMKRLRRMGANAFDKLIKNGASYSRLPPGGAAVSRTNAQVDVSAITGVPALRRIGTRTIYP